MICKIYSLINSRRLQSCFGDDSSDDSSDSFFDDSNDDSSYESSVDSSGFRKCTFLCESRDSTENYSLECCENFIYAAWNLNGR